MSTDADEILLQKCKTLIEAKLGWDQSESWTNHDFQMLSERIQSDTGVSLSIATLKRIWGKVKYDSKPTVTTLNALANFIGFENWRAFRQQNAGSVHSLPVNGTAHEVAPEPKTLKPARKNFIRSGLIGTALCGGAILLIIFGLKRSPETDGLSFSFSSKKVVSEGVPNSVVFDYDATAAREDSVFIQQSWDERLRKQVPKNQHQHTSIYYTPGFFQAKLVVDGEVVREHNLYITTKDWIALVKQEPVPFYFKDTDFHQAGMLSLPIEKLRENNISFVSEPPITSYYHVKDYGEIHTDDFNFETRVRSGYKEGAGVCQHAQILLLTEGSVIIFPLTIKGCVSDIGLVFNGNGIDGKTKDLSAFGVDMSDWVNLKCEVKDRKGTIWINDQVAYQSNWTSSEKIVGMIFRFQGTGSIDWVRLASGDGTHVFEDSFDD